MAVPFLPQPVLRSPDNADLSRPLALLGDTIGQKVQAFQRQSLLSDVLNSPNPDFTAAATRLLQAGDVQGAVTMAQMGQQQFQRGIQTQQLDLQKGQFGIAQEAAKRAATKDATQKALMEWILAGGGTPDGPPPPGAAPSTSLLQPPSPSPMTPGGFGAPVPNIPYQTPQQAPAYVPPQLGAPAQPQAAPGFDARFSGLPATQGVPRRELALSMLGYGDTAKLMAENRRNQPANIAMKGFAEASGKNAAEQQQEQPKSLAAAEAAIQSASKAGNEAVRLMTHSGLAPATGPIAGRTWSLRENTANFDADLKTLGTKVFVTAINEMRALSKTGGALGSVTEKEIDKMENSWRAITQVQGPGNLRQNLGKLADDFNDSMARIARAYEMQFGQKMQYEKIQIPTLNKDGTLPKVTLNGGSAGTVPRYTWAD